MYNTRYNQYPFQSRRATGRHFLANAPIYSNPYALETGAQPGWGRDTGWGNNWTSNQQAVTPIADILELDEQFILEIALPGVVLDDVELKMDENVLTVVAKRTPAMFEERANFLRRELPLGYFVRHFEFDALIAFEHIEARLDRGILFISLPKVEAAMRIPVSHGSLESHMPGMKTRVGSKGEIRSGKELAVK